LPNKINGSFRDPSGYVYEHSGRIFRTITERAVEDYRYIRDAGVLNDLVNGGFLIPAIEVDPEEAGLDSSVDAGVVVEHPRIPFISYPYEWSFQVLKAAALHHLDLHIELFGRGITLTDATAYNVQFLGAKPIFIDLLSTGYRQFCEQFLNPLLLRSYTGVAHNAWCRGSPEGISATELARVLPLRRKLSPRTFIHVVLHGRLQASKASSDKAKSARTKNFSKTAYLGMLHQQRSWIANLQPADDQSTVWQDYADTHNYSPEEHQNKKTFISSFVESVRPSVLWDFGCNTGDFSEVALKAGAETVIGFDFDQGALDAAFARAREGRMNFLPLFQDATNPSPDQGWRQAERDGLGERRNADALLGLALIHHLAIGRNVPLPEIVTWLTGLAPCGVVEFVPKEDPMIQQMLMLREDIFDDYSYEIFRALLCEHAQIVREQSVSTSGRVLLWYDSSGNRH
jgi:ribosomal protein L11 methylase PrmA